MYYRQNFLNKLSRKYSKFAIKNLMLILIGAMGIVFLMNLMLTRSMGVSLYYALTFDRAAILAGEVWRIFTFLFLPPASGVALAVLMLYFYYFIGSSLEDQWGAFGFTAFYALGALGSIISGFITGYADNTYLNLTLFLAYAILYPKTEFRLFFLIPIEAKWIGIADAAVLLWLFITSSWSGRLGIVVALINIIIFFTPHLKDYLNTLYRRWKWNQNFRK